MDVPTLREKFAVLEKSLDERRRRLVFAAEARTLGRGGIELVHRATGMARSTLGRGISELEQGHTLPLSQIRRAGGGRKTLVERDPSLLSNLELLVEPGTRGDPGSLLRWTLKSVRVLSRELDRRGHIVSYPVVAELLAKNGYSLQGNQKTKEGTHHPDRNAQFEYINAQAITQLRASQPVISMDSKKKELVGDFKNAGREWRPLGMPEKVRVHDFEIEENGKAIPNGVYDLKRNDGWVSVGIDHDAASFAVHTIGRWWQEMGRAAYPRAMSLLIIADAGGSKSPRIRLWKWELQRFANRTGLTLHILHFPPGTSKWNKIEHRLFSFITQ
ncbi:MAG: ISAzo13 family transposase, partial [Thermoplasmata archaeon]